MSRIGKNPIPVPSSVKANISSDRVEVEGPKGKLSTPVPKGIRVRLDDGTLLVERQSEEKNVKALHGLTRALLANAVRGVTQGFRKELDVVGIGYRAEVKGRYLNLSLGFSHPVEFPLPENIDIKVERQPRDVPNYVATIVVDGIDKYQVGQVAADIRSLRPPDAYKGKGIRYAGELVRLKVGKKGA